MKQQRIISRYKDKQALVVDKRKSTIPEVPFDPQTVNIPVRAVFFVEVKDMARERVQLLIQEINGMYNGARGGVHYVIPVRHGKLGSDIVFENEFLAVVEQMCTVENGKIVLKDGAQDVHVVRETIPL